MYGDAFPHETNMDRLHGVDFDKGCYVGRGSGVAHAAPRHRAHPHGEDRPRRLLARRPAQRSSPVTSRSAPCGSTAGEKGLALVRVDRVADALDAGAGADRGRPAAPPRRSGCRSHPTQTDRRMSRTAQDCIRTARRAARGRARTRSTSPITTTNGACPSMTTARSTKS